MNVLMGILSGWWAELFTGAGLAIAIVVAYFGGKNIGTVRTQAKADVQTAQKSLQQTEQVAAKQTEIVKVIKDVKQGNNALSDSAARDGLRSGRYHSKD